MTLFLAADIINTTKYWCWWLTNKCNVMIEINDGSIAMIRINIVAIYFIWSFILLARKSAGIKQNDQKSEINQNGIASISIPMSSLFTNCISVSNTLNEAVSSLDEVVVIITLDKPLLSDYQRHKLNPMVLTVHSASPMPQNGMSFEEMKTKYEFFLLISLHFWLVSSTTKALCHGLHYHNILLHDISEESFT